MPQATRELQEQWHYDNGHVDNLAMDYLINRGFTFSRGGIIVAPKDHDFVDKDFSAIDYLCQEWDYGWNGAL